MLLSYEECIKKYKSDYQIRKQISLHNLYKIEPGVYSDKKFESHTVVVMKKYPRAVFTLNSAFYYQGLTDTIPQKYYLQTDKDDAKISDKRIKQCFDNCSSMEIGVETIDYTEVCKEQIRKNIGIMYDPEIATKVLENWDTVLHSREDESNQCMNSHK